MTAEEMAAQIMRQTDWPIDEKMIAQTITKAVAEERVKLILEADARAKRYTGTDDKWGAGYTCAMQQFAAAIRKRVKP